MTASVPLDVIGDPPTERKDGTVIATLVTVPTVGVVQLVLDPLVDKTFPELPVCVGKRTFKEPLAVIWPVPPWVIPTIVLQIRDPVDPWTNPLHDPALSCKIDVGGGVSAKLKNDRKIVNMIKNSLMP